MQAKAIRRYEVRNERQDEQMSWRAAAALWVGLATLGWMGVGAVVSALV